MPVQPKQIYKHNECKLTARVTYTSETMATVQIAVDGQPLFECLLSLAELNEQFTLEFHPKIKTH